MKNYFNCGEEITRFTRPSILVFPCIIVCKRLASVVSNRLYSIIGKTKNNHLSIFLANKFVYNGCQIYFVRKKL